MASFYPQELDAMIKHASKLRFAAIEKGDQDDQILMTEEWASLLNAHPFKAAKKGKMIHLLKQSSKATSGVKSRRKYKPLDFNDLV